MNKKRVLSLLAVVIVAMSLVSVAFATETATNTDSTSTAQGGEPWWGGIISFLPIIIIFAVFYFVLIRPENKRKKETANMRENLAVGDEITTIGGIIGEITTVSDDQIIIKTSNENNKIRLAKWSVSTVNKKANND